MPSLALGKLLSSGVSKINPHHDTPTKKSRGRSASDKRPQENVRPLSEFPSPPYVDRTISDSYFSVVKRRTIGYGEKALETDDYGFPVVDISHSPVGLEESIEPSKPLWKGKCRTCDQSFQTSATTSHTCDYCSTKNLVGSQSGKDESESTPRPLSITKTQEVIDDAIRQGLKKFEERRKENVIPQSNKPPAATSSAPAGHPSVPTPRLDSLDPQYRHSVLLPPNPPFKKPRRRGSAPDTELPRLNGHKNAQSQQALRRKSPGHLALNGLDKLTAEAHNISPFGLPATAGPTRFVSPWANGTPSPKVVPEVPRKTRDPIRESFRPLFDLLAESFTRKNLNLSFSTIRKHQPGRSAGGEQAARNSSKRSQDIRSVTPPPQISQMDHKDLMVGDVYDVASSLVTERASPSKKQQSKADPLLPKLVSLGSPHIDWKLVQKWYDIVLSIGIRRKEADAPEGAEYENTNTTTNRESRRSQILEDLGFQIRSYLLELTEQIIIAPQKAPEDPEHTRYLLILLANPLLLSPKQYPHKSSRRTRSATLPLPQSAPSPSRRQPSPSRIVQKDTFHTARQNRITCLLLATLTNTSLECHNHLVSWFSRYSEDVFRKHIDMLLQLINERMCHRHLESRKPRNTRKSETYNGIPTSQMFNDMLRSDVVSSQEKRSQDWQLRSGCKTLQLFVRANDHFHSKANAKYGHSISSTRKRPQGKQLLPAEYFYNSQLDSEDKFNPREDFDEWEKKAGGFQLSQFPFLLTLGTKIKVLEFDARKKMATKARQEFFDSLMRHTSVERYFHLKIRRKCMIEDSLQRISEAINSSEEEAKKALRVHFEGEEGIDAGGLRKEWFLLLVKELLDPRVGEYFKRSVLLQR